MTICLHLRQTSNAITVALVLTLQNMVVVIRYVMPKVSKHHGACNKQDENIDHAKLVGGIRPQV